VTTTASRKLTLSGVMAQHAKNKSAPGLILPRVKDHMLKTYGWDADRDPTVIHPSEMAKADWCLRATALRILSGEWPPEKEKFDFVRENIFATGNDIHTKWQSRMIDAGMPMWGDWKCRYCGVLERDSCRPLPGRKCYSIIDGEHHWEYREITLDAKRELLIAGHSDGGFDDCLVEIKSIGLGTIRIDAPDLLARYQDGKMTDLTGLWKSGITKPLISHRRQGDVYLHLAHVLGLPFTKIVYLYEFKPNQMTKEFTVTYDRSRSMDLIAKAEQVKYAVEQGIPPECNKGAGCKQCNVFPQAPRRTVAQRRSDLT
jgi:hypothetical protein